MGLKKTIFIQVSLLLSLLTIFIFLSSTVYNLKYHRTETINNYIVRAEILAEQFNQLIIWNDRVALRKNLKKEVETDNILEYAFVEKFGRSFEHTFAKGIPVSLLTREKNHEKSPSLWTFRNQLGHIFYDVAVNISDIDATLHLGLKRAEIDKSMAKFHITTAIIGLILIALGINLAIFLAHRLTREVDILVKAITSFGDEDEKSKLEIPTNKYEVNRLVDAFNKLIAERKLNQAALLETTSKLKGIIDSINDPIKMIDKNKNIIWANEIALKECGENIIGSKCYNTFEEKAMCQNCILDKIFNDGKVHEHEHEVILENGNSVVFWCTGSVAQRNEDGSPKYIVITSRNITEKREAEKKLREKQEIKAQAQKMEAIGQLAGGVAHDFNNLLAVIMSYNDLSLQELSKNHPIKPYLNEIDKAVVKASNLTKKLLLFSRKEDTQPVFCNVNELIKDLRRMLERLIGENIEILENLSKDAGMIYVDTGQLEQVIMNLIINARDALPHGGQINIQTKRLDLKKAKIYPYIKPSEYVIISISDNGIGMDKKIKNRIFEPFFTTKKSGTGLGLATCYGIINQNNGHITLTSETGKGTTFYLYFPLVKGKIKEKTSKTIHNIDQGKETILIVEDEEGLLKIYEKILQSKNFKILTAKDGKEAFDIIRNYNEGKIDLILSDIVMPKMGGIELVKKVRKLLPETKILLASGYSKKFHTLKPKTKGNVNYLSKPFRPDDLIHKIREILDGNKDKPKKTE